MRHGTGLRAYLSSVMAPRKVVTADTAAAQVLPLKPADDCEDSGQGAQEKRNHNYHCRRVSTFDILFSGRCPIRFSSNPPPREGCNRKEQSPDYSDDIAGITHGRPCARIRCSPPDSPLRRYAACGSRDANDARVTPTARPLVVDVSEITAPSCLAKAEMSAVPRPVEVEASLC